MTKPRRQPRDVNQLAAAILASATRDDRADAPPAPDAPTAQPSEADVPRRKHAQG